MGADDILRRRDGESDFAYHKRIVYAKVIDHALKDVSYQELSDLIYGQHYSEDVARRLTYGSCRTLQLMDAERLSMQDDDVMDEIDGKLIELKKEKQKVQDQRRAFDMLVRSRARQEELNEIITQAIRDSSLPSLDTPDTGEPVHPCALIDSQDDGCDMLVSLNDIHYGADYSHYWGVYNSDVCAQMMREYANRVIQIGKQHGCRRCIVWANGDMISGSIHKSIQVTNKENVIEQVMGVSELIASFIATLSWYFTEVKFTSVAGNHSRLESKEDALYSERLDDLVEWYLKARLAMTQNVEIGFGERIDPTIYIFELRGKNYVGVHGDYDPSPAHIQALQTMVGKPVYAVLMGHMHHNSVDAVQGVRTVMSGSFLGMDDYAITKRLYGRPEQLVCVCDNSGIVCYYDVELRTTGASGTDAKN